ncbi:MAG: response regulator [Ignavibacteriaceae bacterium]|nr:response regulator [Ignavibacteriaceae bacterium]
MNRLFLFSNKERKKAMAESGKYSILLVEDNIENKDVITYFIKNMCDVDTAADGPSSVEMVKGKQYDCILMDINLGLGMNGIEATRQIRLIPGYEKTPIIAVTAYAMVGDREVFLEAGCTHYISKPFTKQEILSLLKTVLEEEDHDIF